MVDTETLLSSLDLLRRAQSDLRRIRTTYANDPVLLAVYEPGAQYLVNAVRQSIIDMMDDGLTTEVADVWVRLVGDCFSEGRAPAGLLGSFLRNLTVANKHAVAILEDRTYDSGRFPLRIDAISEFDVVAITSGSLRLGLRRPSPVKLMDTDRSKEDCLLPEAFWDQLGQACRDTEIATMGLNLLVRALRAADSDEEFESLMDTITPQRVLELMYHVRSVVPTRRSAIQMVEFSGPALESQRTVVATADTWDRLTRRMDSINTCTRYVSGYGVLRAADLDRQSYTIRNFTFSIPPHMLDQISCSFEPAIEDQVAEALFNKPVEIRGLLVYDKYGQPRELQIQEFTLIAFQEQTLFPPSGPDRLT